MRLWSHVEFNMLIQSDNLIRSENRLFLLENSWIELCSNIAEITFTLQRVNEKNHRTTYLAEINVSMYVRTKFYIQIECVKHRMNTIVCLIL